MTEQRAQLTLRYRCTWCSKLTAGRQARGAWEAGDGTFYYPRRHKREGKPCPGNLHEADWVEVDASGKVVSEHLAGLPE